MKAIILSSTYDTSSISSIHVTKNPVSVLNRTDRDIKNVNLGITTFST